MPAKALNKKNLTALGADRLAELLIEVTKGKADLQRRVRLELSAHQGADDVARDIRKRYASIRQAKGYLSRKTHRNFAKEIRSMIVLVDTSVAPSDPNAAFDLLWELLHLGPGVLGRTKDHSEILSEVFGEVMAAIARFSPRMDLAPDMLADTVFETLRNDKSGIFENAIPALAQALGSVGLERMKASVSTALSSVSITRRPPNQMNARLDRIRRDVADAQGDVDAYVASHDARQLKDGDVAVAVGKRLLAADRAGEALAIAQGAGSGIELDDLVIACLGTLDRREELRDFLWKSFTIRPNAERLRQYLRLLPDFDDIDAEHEAKRIAQAHVNLSAALDFLVTWRDFAAASGLIMDRHKDLDGSDYEMLTPAADALEASFPLASVLLRRAMIISTLESNRTIQYRRAADHLQTCARLDPFIEDFGGQGDHACFLHRLRTRYGRRQSFWIKASAKVSDIR